MRLINIRLWKIEDFENAEIPPYAIASHRWISDETTYQTFNIDRQRKSEGYWKVRKFCDFVTRERPDVQYLWIDSCCIDRTNSTELSEAINSMFRWYKNSKFCVAHLSDIQKDEDIARSVWFKRGWTLQELLAPDTVVFTSRSWTILGAKACRSNYSDTRNQSSGNQRLTAQSTEYMQFPASLNAINARLAGITGVPEAVLWDFHRSQGYSMSVRLEWMKERQTTKPEDYAYSQLGMFDVYMPLIYGEGKDNALGRLRRKLERRSQQEAAARPPPPPPAQAPGSSFSATAQRSPVPRVSGSSASAIPQRPNLSQMSGSSSSRSISDDQMRALVRKWQDYARRHGITVPSPAITEQQIHTLAMNPEARATYFQRIKDRWIEEEAGEGETSDEITLPVFSELYSVVSGVTSQQMKAANELAEQLTSFDM